MAAKWLVEAAKNGRTATKCTPWKRTVMPSGQTVTKRDCGASKWANVFQVAPGRYGWVATKNGNHKRGTAKTMKAAKAAAGRHLSKKS